MTITITHDNHAPYNPWQSYLVEASAGSGKTWQLSRRFLALVIAGADPSSILTVTFTKKAAAEMRERIVKDAVELGKNSEESLQLCREISAWKPHDLPFAGKVRTAEEASRAILERTQTLKISTIDSIFLQWTQRFPLETAIPVDQKNLESPWDILSNLSYRQLAQKAWLRLLAMVDDNQENQQLMESIALHAPKGKISSLERSIEPLNKNHTFLWYIQLLSLAEGISYYDVPDHVETIEEFITNHTSELSSLISKIKNPEKKQSALNALDKSDYAKLIEFQIFTKGFKALSGTTFKGLKESCSSEIELINTGLIHRSDNEKLTQLNHSAKLIWTLFNAVSKEIHNIKVKESKGTFSDALKGCSLLAIDENFVGARALAWNSINHLLLDEFQDTSRLQWLIFEKIAIELLAGKSAKELLGPNKSVFIVGDKKQSIYRFREAAPEVLDFAKDSLKKFGLMNFSMSASFRSSNFILNYVNKVFQLGNLIDDFPIHQASTQSVKLNTVKAEYGSLTVYPVCVPTEEEEEKNLTHHKLEARLVANHIKSCVSGEVRMAVFDPKSKSWRSPIYSDFAILYAKGTHSSEFEEALRQLGIPSVKEETKGFFDRPEVKDLNALVTWLVWPADSVALCTILRSPICGVTDSNLQTIISENSANLLSRIQDHSPDVFNMLQAIRDSNKSKPLTEVITLLLTQYRLLERYECAFGPFEGPLARANILKWFDLIRNAAHEDALSTQSWLQALGQAEEEDETGNATLATNAVSLMTIHKSKGLEFPCIVLTGTEDDWHKDDSIWIKDSRPGRESFWYIGSKDMRPESNPVIQELIEYSNHDSRSEKARLLYVALTRATHHLVITGAQKRPKESKKSSSQTTLKDKPESYFSLLMRCSQELSTFTKTSLPHSGIMIHNQIPEISKQQTEILHLVSQANPMVIASHRPCLKILGDKRDSKLSSNKFDSKDQNLDTTKPQIKILDAKVPKELGNIYGTLVHKMFENHIQGKSWGPTNYNSYLEDLMGQAGQSFQNENLATQLITKATAEVNQLLQSEVWRGLTIDAAWMGSEVPMSYIDGDQLVTAKIDLLIVTKDEVFKVVDFKTIPVKPSDTFSFSEQFGYTKQVSTYCDIVRNATQSKHVEGYVLFTDPIHLLEITQGTTS